jgi:hypothetical protein
MRERQIQKIEVHVAGICFRETETGIEVLIAKRQSNRNYIRASGNAEEAK